MSRTTLAILAAACALLQPMRAQADGPTFPCAKAQGTVEKQICADAALAALDRKLADVYKAATAAAKGPSATRLKQDQRGWVKGRNDCWKANGQQTWITATWTVDTVPACISAQYRQRIAELQAVWRLLPPRTVRYACQGSPANEVVVHTFASDPPALRLERGDQTKTLWQVGTTGKFEGQNVELTQQEAAVAVQWLNTDTGKTDTLQCTLR
jgi:uncharacterized protein